QRSEHRAHHPKPRFPNSLIFGFALHAPVATHVVVVTVAIILAVVPVVLLLVAGEVAQGVAVMRGNEVDARVHGAIAPAVNVAGPRQARRKFRHHSRVTTPETAHRVAVLPVPLGPANWEVPKLVATRPDIPGFRDQLHLVE